MPGLSLIATPPARLWRWLSARQAARAALRAMLVCLAGVAPAGASPSAEICEWATVQVAGESGVPADILAAVALTETGRRHEGVVRPWAWSVNAEGAGSWFDDPNEALAFAEDRIAQGRRNVDIGCFQLNYRWHGENFASVAQMFDPLTNARYAARFLRQLHAETGDWRAAAGAFHSRSPAEAARYLARFDDLHALVRERGVQGLSGSPETYNRFAAADPGMVRALPPPRQRVMLLGAPLGTARDGRAGSLVVMGAPRVALLSARTRGPLLARAGPGQAAAAEDQGNGDGPAVDMDPSGRLSAPPESPSEEEVGPLDPVAEADPAPGAQPEPASRPGMASLWDADAAAAFQRRSARRRGDPSAAPPAGTELAADGRDADAPAQHDGLGDIMIHEALNSPQDALSTTGPDEAGARLAINSTPRDAMPMASVPVDTLDDPPGAREAGRLAELALRDLTAGEPGLAVE